MAVVGLLNAFGSSVGDNLEHHLIARAIQARGHKVRHLWNFNRQKPGDVLACSGLVAGCGGILWKGSNLRNHFFINVIMLAKRAIGCSIGYNQGEPLSPRWIRAVSKMEFTTARDPWTFKWIHAYCKTKVRVYPSVAWIYRPAPSKDTPRYDLGLIINRRAFEINVGEGNPWKLFRGIRSLRCLEIPFAQPTEKAFTKTVPNNNKLASVASRCIQQCKVVYTQRLHGFILALANGVPAICHGGGFKVQGQADMIGYPLTRTFKQLRELNLQGWQDLLKEAGDLNPSDYVKRARGDAAKHIGDLEKWLQTL